jgi:hypothetical protein
MEAGVTMTIDGLNVFSFSEIRDPKTGGPAGSTFILSPKSTSLVKGWPITASRSDKFLVGDYAQSAAAELKASESKVGVITVTFFAAWPKEGPPPSDEPTGKAADATRRGAATETPFTVIERKYGVPRATVSVRYARSQEARP